MSSTTLTRLPHGPPYDAKEAGQGAEGHSNTGAGTMQAILDVSHPTLLRNDLKNGYNSPSPAPSPQE